MNFRSPVKRLVTFLVLALPLAAFSCAHTSVRSGGFGREAALPEAPDFACVEKAVRAVEAVDAVRYEVSEIGRPLTWKGLGPPILSHDFRFEAKGELWYLSFRVPHKGEVEYNQVFFSRLGSPPPSEEEQRRRAQESVDRVRPVVLRIERAIADQCGVQALTDTVSEYCHEVSCTAE